MFGWQDIPVDQVKAD